MTILTGYKYKLLPRNDQLQLLNQNCGNRRMAYNFILNLINSQYKDEKKWLSRFDAIKLLPSLKQDYSYLKLSESSSLQQGIIDLYQTLSQFMKRKKTKTSIGFPKFKRKGNNDKFRVVNNGNIKIEENRVYIPKLGWFLFKKHRNLPIGVIQSITISNRAGHWFISFLVKHENQVCFQKTGKSMGLDWGMKTFITTNYNTKYISPNISDLEKKIDDHQRLLSRKKKGSNNRNKVKQRLSKLYYKLFCKRQDYLHQLSTHLVKHYDIITVESLDLQSMIDESPHSNITKSIYAGGWHSFVNMLQYKTERNDKALVKADKWFASSKVSYYDGTIKNDLSLSERRWIDNSGNKIDRDLNAAKNLNHWGIVNINEQKAMSTNEYALSRQGMSLVLGSFKEKRSTTL